MHNRKADIETIYLRSGKPALETKDLFKAFTRRVAACLHFGYVDWGIAAEPGWGVRLNSTGPTSTDTLRFKDEFAVDIAPGSGSPKWHLRDDNKKFHWLVYDSDDEGFGVGRVPAHRSDLPSSVDPPVIIAPPPAREANLFTRFREDLRPYFRGDVASHAKFDVIIRATREAVGLPIIESDWADYRAVAHWRYGNGTLLRGTVSHDLGQTFNDSREGRWTTLERQLTDFWVSTEKPTSPTLTPEKNILDFAAGELRGHFLAGPLYFAPSWSIRNEQEFRRACEWFASHDFNCAIWMTEQSHWATRGNRDPSWTDPGPGGAPLIYTASNGLQIYGWPLEEQLRRIRIMRGEYGLHVIASLWEQPRIEHDFDYAIANTPRVVQYLDRDVIAWLNTWEQDEVVDNDRQRILNNAVGAAATKSSGPHWARGIPTATYWDGDRSHVFWHQYDRAGDLTAQAIESVRICRESGRVSIAFEHSGMLPSRIRPVHTLEQCRNRGKLVVSMGEYMSMTG